MNKVFKVIWSEARNAYVVVSEIAKNHGSKSCSTKKLLAMLIATGVMTCASMAPAMAADPPAEALKHSTVAAGYNITVTPKDNSDGGKEYNVDLKNDIYLAGDDPDAWVSISGSKGTIWATGSVTVGSGVDGSVVMDGATATVSGLGNKTTAYAGFANGKGKAATEEQLKEISEVAENANQGWNLSTNGGEASKVAPGETVDFSGDQNINISNDGTKVKVELKNDIYLAGDDADAFVNISGSKGTIWASGSVTAGSVVASDNDGNYSEITPKSAKLGQVTIDEDGKISGVVAGAVTADSTDAVNGSQLHAVATEAGKHSKVVNGSNINVEETDVDGQKIYKVNLNKDIMLGDLTGKYVNISGTNGTIETTGYIATKDRVYADKGAKLADIDVTGNKISNGASSIVLDGSNVKVNDKVTIDQNGKISGVAAGEVSSTSTDAINGSQLHQTNEKVDDLNNRVNENTNKINALDTRVNENTNKINALDTRVNENTNKINALDTRVTDNETAIKNNADAIGNLNTRVDGVEKLAKQHTTVKAGDNNIKVSEVTTEEGRKEYTVALDKNITVDSVKAGDTTISDKGLEIKDGPSVTKDGINAANKNITNVADGKVEKDSKDAINGGQLHQAKADINNRIDGVENQVVSNTNRINQLGSRVNKVGAGAAALAALHPMDFDPDDKLTFSAGYGNYGGENAAAIGAYYRPDEKVMFSVGGTVGNGENMVNAGVSFSLDRTNHVSNSRTAMAREILDLRAEVTELKAMVAKGGLGSIAEDKMKIFPDVAENHWAYEYVGKLAAAGIIEGYPDGKFSGDRMMSRYEFAAMLYRAMQKGAQLDSKIINEFAPEMGRIRVDRISGEDGDRDKIERVRVNAVKGERDHYGNKLAK